MRICIHRGIQEIGGTCIEIGAQGKLIVLRLGLPLTLNSPMMNRIRNCLGVKRELLRFPE